MSRLRSNIPDILRIIYRETTPFVRRQLAWVLMLALASALLTALGPLALKLIVDSFTAPSHGFSSPLMLVSLFAISQWFARAASELRSSVHGRVERRMFRTLSERLFAHLMHLPLRFHLDRQTGAISETLTTGLEGFQLILHHIAFTILPVTAELGAVVLVTSRVAPPLFLALFCGALTAYAGAFTYFAFSLSAPARAASAARVEASAAMTDSLLNYETVKLFAAESIVQERVSGALAGSETEWISFYRLYARNGLIAASICAAFLAVTIWKATAEVRAGRMTVGDFVLVSTYMLQIVRPVEMFGYATQGISQGFAMLDKMLRLFREPTEPRDIPPSGMPTGPGKLEFQRVTLSYPKCRPVLTSISFRIPPKHTLGIVGSSGAGKSTLVRLLVRLIDPDDGEIYLDGVPISSMALPQLRGAVAVVPQDTLLFNDTLAYNIAFGRASASRAEIHEAARVAHVHDFIMGLPDQYETLVGERGLKLSGGERQRISIARAVLKSPRIYVFDEATSSLDSNTEQGILASFREIAEHSSTLIIAHRLSTVLHADEIVVLDEGQITERGTHSSLLRLNGRYSSLWRAQHPDTAAA